MSEAKPMSEALTRATMLRDLVDVLIPGEGAWPSGSLAGVHGVLAMRLLELRGEDAVDELEAMLAAAGGPLAGLDEEARVGVVECLEREAPDRFALLRDTVYLAYYESPAVIRQIQALGQPYKAIPIIEGYEQAPFESERDRPRHNRGHWLGTEDVRRVDLPPEEG